MKSRMISATMLLLALPFWFATCPSGKQTTSVPFAAVAYAGHTLTGDYCTCGTVGCICDPGECCGSKIPPASGGSKKHKGGPPLTADPGFDFGTGALILALALFVWARLRA